MINSYDDLSPVSYTHLLYRRSDTGGGGCTERTARNRSDKGTFQYGGDECQE